jgi:hypothetical protein
MRTSGAPLAFVLLLAAAPAAADELDGAAGLVARIGAARSEAARARERVAGYLEEARGYRDVIRTACLNDKLTQLDVAIRTFDERLPDLLRAIVDGRAADGQHHATVLGVLAERTRVLVGEAEQCIGEELAFAGDTEVRFAVDPGDDARGAQELPEPEPPPRAPPLPGATPEELAAQALAGAPLRIYQASFQMSVHEVEASIGQIVDLAAGLGGFVQERTGDEVTVRVPAARFEEAVAAIEQVGDVLARHVQASEIGEEYRDLAIRLRNAQAMRDRLEGLLRQAQGVEAALQVERELERVTLEIERLEGRMRFLADRISYSTIAVAFRPLPTEGGPDPSGFRLPFQWLDGLGLPALLDLRSGEEAP